MCRAEQLVEMARDRGPRGAMQGKLSPSRARAAGYVSLSPTDTELVVPFRCLWWVLGHSSKLSGKGEDREAGW